MTEIVNKKNIGMSGFVRLLNPKVVKTEKINSLSHMEFGEVRKLIKGIMLAIDNVSATPLIIISNAHKKNCFFLLGLNALQIPFNKK